MNKEISNENDISLNNAVEIIQFNNLLKYNNKIKHCFSTRIGGVSQRELNSLNLGFNRNDDRENVIENYRRISNVLGIELKNIVLSNQIHDNKVKVVDESDRGKGIIKESDIIGYDGLVTNKKEVALVTFYADCVPLFFFDPNKNIIGLSHSGWRSTLRNIAKETVKVMNENFNVEPQYLEVAIGPHIRYCCFEVGSEVYKEFINTFSWCDKYCNRIGENKWRINLEKIIIENLITLGVKRENICVSNICTKCNNHRFFSYRGDKGKTGSLAAIMQLI